MNDSVRKPRVRKRGADDEPTKVDPTKMWARSYRLMMSVILEVAPDVAALGLDPKELFLLSAVDEHTHPAEIAAALCMPKPTVTVMVKRLEAAGFVRREIDTADLRRHRLLLTPEGRRTTTRGLAMLSAAFGGRLSALTARERAQLSGLLTRLT